MAETTLLVRGCPIGCCKPSWLTLETWKRPKEFVKQTYDDDEDDSNVGKMPPSDSDESDS